MMYGCAVGGCIVGGYIVGRYCEVWVIEWGKDCGGSVRSDSRRYMFKFISDANDVESTSVSIE